MLTLRQLRYLDALARQRHFGRAAEECAISPPALSMQIHDLEQFLGGELIERCHGEAILTERGRQVARRATDILNAVRDLVDFAQQNGSGLAGVRHLGVIPTLAPYMVPQLLSELHRSHPTSHLNILEAQTKTLLSELARGKIDLALLTLPIENGEIETMHLFDDRFLLAVPVSDPLPERARVLPRDVEQRNLILIEESHCLPGQAVSYCASARDGPNSGFMTASLPTVLQMVANGQGVTLLPEIAVDVELRDHRIKLLRFAEPQPQRRVGLVWRRSSPCKAGFHTFGEILKEAMSIKPKRHKPNQVPAQ